MLDSFSLSSRELWEEEIEPVISKLRYEKWLDPVLGDKFDALINNYNGSVASGDTTNVLGKVESISTMLSMDSYYRARSTSDNEKRILLKLNENLLLLKTILNGDLRNKEDAERKAAVNELNNPTQLDRLPNLSKEEKHSLYYETEKRK